MRRRAKCNAGQGRKGPRIFHARSAHPAERMLQWLVSHTMAQHPASISEDIVKRIHPVPLTLHDGEQRTALMLGRNLAWACSCGQPMPLLGSLTPWSKEFPPEPVNCPRCNRQYVIFRADAYAETAEVVEFD